MSVSAKIPFDKSDNKKVGLVCENRVIEHLRKNGYRLLYSNMKTPFAEVDLVVQGQRSVVMLEVKSLYNQSFKLMRVRTQQKRRLIRAMSYVENYFKSPVELYYAFVSENKIEFVKEEGD